MNHPIYLFVKKIAIWKLFWQCLGNKAAHISHSMFMRQFEQRSKDTFMQSCFSDMGNSSKCFLYRSLCQEFSMATYLYKIHIPANRKAMTKLRWIPCWDEFHVICECPRYETCRKLYIKPYYVRKPSMDKLIQLLNTDDTIEMQKLSIFIKRVFIIYKDVIYLTSLVYYDYSLLDSGM